MKINIEATKEELEALVSSIGGIEDAIDKVMPALDKLDKIAGPFLPAVLQAVLLSINKKFGGEK